MHEAAEMAGFFAAHAVWCIAEGETLVPLVGVIASNGKRQMSRLVDDRLEDAVSHGQELLDANEESALAAALVYDGFVTLRDGRTDALIIEVRSYRDRSALQIVVPYRHANDALGFAVYRPKFRSYTGPDTDLEAVGQAFFSGVDQHEQGAPVWNACLDQSR